MHLTYVGGTLGRMLCLMVAKILRITLSHLTEPTGVVVEVSKSLLIERWELGLIALLKAFEALVWCK